MTFLNGPHSCLGYRFSLNEWVRLSSRYTNANGVYRICCRMKVAAFTLLRAFEFEPAASADDIAKSPTLLARPMRISDSEAGPQMPLFIRAYRGD